MPKHEDDRPSQATVNCRVYGVQTGWQSLRRDDLVVTRCMVGRLMTRLGLCGGIRGKGIKTTISGTDWSLDHLKRQFQVDAPNQVWVKGPSDASTWQGFIT